MFLELRNRIREVAAEIGQDRSFSSDQVIRALRQRYPKAINESAFALENMALGRLINEIGRTQTSGIVEGPDLFGYYSGVPSVIVTQRQSKKHKRAEERKLRNLVTIGELADWLERRSQPRVRNDDKESVRKLLDDVKPLGLSKEATLKEALEKLAQQRGSQSL
ncbi:MULTISPECIES: hypothetical protein [Mesorhizobium]|uniref:hypothetical protein n=1 Tax=Mesorhizobium TaxID=68287 RepID=UPI0012DB0A7E|nr:MULTISPECIES: hypothetical protein [Mesorhizobium]